MEIKYLEGHPGSNWKFSVNGVIMYIWNSFKRSIMSLDNFAQSYNFQKPMFAETEEGIIKFLLDNQEFIKAYLNKATKEQELLDSYKLLPKKKLIARAEDTVLICEITLERGYVSVTANQICPTREKDLIQQGSEMMLDFYVGEQGMSQKEAKEQIKQDIAYNGIEAVADISLFSDTFQYRNVSYAFDSQSCGCLHKEIKKAFSENKILHKLIKMHLNEKTDMVEAIWLYSQIKGSENYRQDVIEIGKQIVSGK